MSKFLKFLREIDLCIYVPTSQQSVNYRFFHVIQILREIILADLRRPKTVNLEALNFLFVWFQTENVKNFQKCKIQGFLNGQNGQF